MKEREVRRGRRGGDGKEYIADEIRFRQSSMNSMFEKAQKQKDTLAIENAELKRRLTELGVNVEVREKGISVDVDINE